MHTPVNTEPIRVEVEEILQNLGDDWRASAFAELLLSPLVTLGNRLREAGALDDARAVFNTIITSILARYEQLWDAESEIASVVTACVDGLALCLGLLSAPTERQPLLEDLFAVYRWDALESGGYGMDMAPRRVLLEQTTSDERRTIASWLLDALPVGSDTPTRWRRQEGGRFILQLRADAAPSDMEREQLYERADLAGPHLDLLLTQGRTAEALRLTQRASADALVALAETLTAAGLAEQALAAVRGHVSVLHADRKHTRDWLRARGVTLPEGVEQLCRMIATFNEHPTVRGYRELRERAEQAARWPQALELIASPKPLRLPPVRARLFADLDRADEALAELSNLSDSAWRTCAEDLAQTFAARRPLVAADLYEQLAVERVAHGTRGARKKAAEFRAKRAELVEHLR